MSEWKDTTLGALCVKIGSGATPTGGKSAYCDSGISLIRSQNVLDFSFSEDGLAYINDFQARKLEGVTVKENDVLLNITGDSVARVCIVPQEYLPARVNQHVAIIRPQKDIFDYAFCLYLLQKEKKKLLSLASTGGTRNALTKNMLEDYIVSIPDFPTQRRIAAILSSLDAKIENNNKVNAKLEEIAQNLFKEWFVDFGPFKDGKFVDSELGPIPEGWRVLSLSQIADFKNGLAMQKFPPKSDSDSLPVLKIKELGQGFCDKNSDLCSEENIGKDYVVNDGDVIFSWSGTLRVDIWVGGKCGLNQHLFKVTSLMYSKSYYYWWTKHHLAKFINIAKDKAVTMGHIKRDELDKAKVLLPNNMVLQKYDNIMSPILDKIVALRQENQRLATLRDTLLPKLMSGEIEV